MSRDHRVSNPPLRARPLWPILALSTLALAIAWFIGPVSQDPAYHHFADSRPCGPLPNCLNVLSNLAFVGVGGLGLRTVTHWSRALRPPFLVFWWGIVLTGLGSAWYHWEPTDARLVWDRSAMTLVFMGLFAAVLIDQFKMGLWVLAVLVLTGLSSILVWRLLGDLRFYGLVQFLPPALILAIYWRYPPGEIPRGAIWLALGCYVLAKLAEFLDVPIFEATGWISGHTLKHLLAALAPIRLIRGPHSGRTLPGTTSAPRVSPRASTRGSAAKRRSASA